VVKGGVGDTGGGVAFLGSWLGGKQGWVVVLFFLLQLAI